MQTQLLLSKNATSPEEAFYQKSFVKADGEPNIEHLQDILRVYKKAIDRKMSRVGLPSVNMIKRYLYLKAQYEKAITSGTN